MHLRSDLFGLVEIVVPDGDITVPEGIKSQNATQYRHWSVYHAACLGWRVALEGIPHCVLPPARVVLEITSRRARPIDMGNLIGGAKPIPDILINKGILHDDSAEWADISYQMEIVPKADRGTRLRWWRIPPGRAVTRSAARQAATSTKRVDRGLQALARQLHMAGVHPDHVPHRLPNASSETIDTVQRAIAVLRKG